MEEQEIKAIITRELPSILRSDGELRAFVLESVTNYFAGKQETESRFDRILEELRRDREEQSRKWEEQNRKWDEHQKEQNRKWEEQNRKWDEHQKEQNRKWEEQNRKWDEHQKEQNRKWDEQDRKWEEHQKEQNRKWDEQDRKWEEHQKEQNRKWEEQNRKWEENQKQLNQIISSVRRLDGVVEELQRDREENNRKWEEQGRKWEEQNRKWDENQKQLNQIISSVQTLSRKHDATIGALGARWGLYSEESFRKALKGILEDSFGVEVINVTEYDHDGEVFGRPDQIELDLLIKNGLLIICEIKSSMSKADMYLFERKVRFYESRHSRSANRKLAISPMVHPRAKEVANNLGIEVYSYGEDVAIE